MKFSPCSSNDVNAICKDGRGSCDITAKLNTRAAASVNSTGRSCVQYANEGGSSLGRGEYGELIVKLILKFAWPISSRPVMEFEGVVALIGKQNRSVCVCVSERRI